MLKKMLTAVAFSAVAASAFANNAGHDGIEQVIQLKNGSTVYVFDGGKMAMESRFGRATRMAPGTVMETKDGRKITMVGDEVARLDVLLDNESDNN